MHDTSFEFSLSQFNNQIFKKNLPEKINKLKEETFHKTLSYEIIFEQWTFNINTQPPLFTISIELLSREVAPKLHN